jgi:phosphatidylserine decarboxylase
MLNFLYKNKAGKIVRRIFTNKAASKIVGIEADSKISRKQIKPFIKKNKINMDEFLVPEGGYKTFNEFFYRNLKPGTRTIDSNENVISSPADCHSYVIPKLTAESTFFVKECKFDLKKFLKDKKLAKEYENGTLILFRLSPADYHRFHFPFECTPGKANHIKGNYESVNPIAYESGVQPLTENVRRLIILKSKNFGQVLFVEVGAMFVGKIHETFKPNQKYKKGDEAGYFAFGASSLVLLFKPNTIQINDELLQNSQDYKETEVKMGQAIAKKI